jgi:predicted enzyme related to lactoylglutathione lyase
MMSLNYTAALVTIAAPNFDRLVSFYQALFSQEPTTYYPNVYAEFQLPGLRLGIFRPKEPYSSPRLPIDTPVSLCIEVVNLESAIAHLTQLGYPPPGVIVTASHGREINAYDPDGNRLILYQAQRL